MIPLSVLDLSPVPKGSNVGQSLRNTLDLAQHAEEWGFNRYWLAEHHNMPGIASAATSVVIAHVAQVTKTMRVGAGGIMLPNHAPLIIAEQFGTLAALHPGRIDLGLGRAPGTDMLTARALRRDLDASANNFPNDVVELMHYFAPSEEGARLRAIPGEGQDVDVWILGSSLFGAQLAAMLGRPYAFASHFAPAEMGGALQIYRERFENGPRPHAMLGLNIVAADTDEEAQFLFSSQQQAFVNIRTGMPGQLPAPVEGYYETLDEQAKMLLAHSLSCAIVGSKETVRKGLDAFIERWQPDELMITAMVHDHEKRLRSYEIVAEIMREANTAETAPAISVG